MLGQFVSSLAPSNFGVPGVYVYNAPAQQITPTGPALNAVGIVGTGQWGAKNIPTPFTTEAAGQAAFGTNTTLANSIMLDAHTMIPEGNLFYGVRVTDGTDTAATIPVYDASGTVLLGTLTAVFTGSLPNGVNSLGIASNPAQASFAVATGSLLSGGTGAAPTVRFTVTFPNASAETFTVVAGTAALGYQAATLRANLTAAINVGSAQNAPSARWTWASGSVASTALATGVSYPASGGTDGATTITTSVLVGTDGNVGRTGLYALRGAVQGGQYVFAGCYDLTVVQTMAVFNAQEGTRSGVSFPIRTATTTAQTLKATNNASDRTVDTVSDWLYIADPFTGLYTYVAPAAKCEAVISSLDFYQPPLNKPERGALGFLSTDRSTNPVSGGEAAARFSSGIQYFGNTSGAFQLQSDRASDGVSRIADVRAGWYFGIGFMSTLQQFIGKTQSTAANDRTRANARGAVNAFMSQSISPVQKISGYSLVMDQTNNTGVTVPQGFLNGTIAIQTLAGIEFVLMSQQVGAATQITVAAS